MYTKMLLKFVKLKGSKIINKYNTILQIKNLDIICIVLLCIMI